MFKSIDCGTAYLNMNCVADITSYMPSLVIATDLVTQETLTFLSYATREDDKIEDEAPTLTLKPNGLPNRYYTFKGCLEG